MEDAPPPALPDLEAAAMDEVWSREQATTREVLEALNADAAKPRAYTTVMTIMTRLEAKGMVVRERDGRHDVYRPAVSRHDYREARAAAEVDAVLEQYGDLAMAHFANRVGGLNPERRARLEDLARGN